MSSKKAGRFIAQRAFWIAWLLGMAMPYNARHDMLVDTGVYVPDSIPDEPGDTALVSMVLFIAAITLQSFFLLTHKTPPEKKKSIFYCFCHSDVRNKICLLVATLLLAAASEAHSLLSAYLGCGRPVRGARMQSSQTLHEVPLHAKGAKRP